MKIAITGGTEFVGGALAHRLDATGHQVFIVVRRRPIFVLPIAVHLALSHLFEATMRVPLIAVAQVHILAEGVTMPAPFAEVPPADLAPSTPFDDAAIRAGLPDPGGFRCRDLRWCRA